MKTYKIILLIFACFYTGIQAQSPGELEHKRTMFIKTFVNANNLTTLEISAAPIHYRETTGIYRPIKTGWRQVDSLNYAVEAGFYEAFYFKEKGAGFPIFFEMQDGTYFKSELISMGYYDISSGLYKVLEPARHFNGKPSGNALTFSDVFSGVDASFDYHLAKLKETFYLTQKGRDLLISPKQLGLNENTSYLVFRSEIEPDTRLEAFAGNVKIASSGKGQGRALPFNYQGQGRVDFKMLSGKQRYFMPKDFATIRVGTDSTNSKVEKTVVFKRIESTQQGDFLYAGIPYKWIQRMPNGTIAIDPTVGVQPVSGNGKDTFIYKGNNGDGNFGAVAGMQIGPDTGLTERRGIIQIDVDAIPQNSVITKATLQLYLYTNWGTAADFTIEAHKMLIDWVEGTGTTWGNTLATGADWNYADEPTVQWQTPGMGAGQDYDAPVLSETLIELTDDEVWKSWDVTAAVQSWVDGGANYGLAMVTKAADLSKHIGVMVRSSDYSEDPTLCPKLIVEIQVQPLVSYTYQYNSGNADFTVTADLANGVIETTNFNARGFLLDRTYNNGSDIFDFTNTYDKAGNLAQQTFAFNGSGQTTLEFVHDDLYRLKDFKKNSVVQRSYAYDDNGNIKTLGTKTFTYGNPGTNQITSDGASSYTYDAGGRINSIGSDVLKYDYRSLMTAYLTPGVGANNQWNKYDAAGRRVRKSEDFDSRFYLFSGPDVLAEYAIDTYPDAEYIFAGGRRIAKLQSKDDTPRAAVSMKVESAGFNDGNYARLYVDGTNYSPNQRGYNLVVIDESGGTVVDQVSFDTYGSTANADAMADYINGLPHGRIVLAGILDEASLNMTENAYLALESLGSVACRNVGFRHAHAFIGRAGVLSGTVQEEHVPQFGGPAEVGVHKVDCRVQSAGFDDGFLVNLFVNGVDVGTNNRGHNIVVVDEITGNVINAVSYDTYGNTANADAMATAINSLPAGRIVLVGISDDGSVSMTENAYLALETLGSAETRNVAFRDSWAMIGVKGAAIGTVPELHVPRFSGYAEVSLEAPSVHLVDGFHFYYTDHLNSTRMLDDWDPGQAEIQVDYYFPFGEINTQSGGGEDTHYKFTGYEEDTGIGLDYAKARFYNPGLGRFNTPDPAGQYFSPYAYVGNRPLDYVDPSGLFGLGSILGGIGDFVNWSVGGFFGELQRSNASVQAPIYGRPGFITDNSIPGGLAFGNGPGLPHSHTHGPCICGALGVFQNVSTFLKSFWARITGPFVGQRSLAQASSIQAGRGRQTYPSIPSAGQLGQSFGGTLLDFAGSTQGPGDSYVNLNVTVVDPVSHLGGTGGLMIDSHLNVNTYLGAAASSSSGFAVTYSAQPVSTGFNVGYWGFASKGKTFGPGLAPSGDLSSTEIGVSQRGVGVSFYYVFGNW